MSSTSSSLLTRPDEILNLIPSPKCLNGCQVDMIQTAKPKDMVKCKLVGGWALPLWKIWVRQLGWWHSQLNGKSFKIPWFQTFPVTTNQVNYNPIMIRLLFTEFSLCWCFRTRWGIDPLWIPNSQRFTVWWSLQNYQVITGPDFLVYPLVMSK